MTAPTSLITGGTFTTVQGDFVVNPPDERKRINALTLLKNNIAAGALHDSADRYDPPKCHPQTREIILQEIEQWIQHDSGVHPFLWLYGPAGSGKSSIAQSLAEMLDGAEELAASFFFSRAAAGWNDDSHLVATIAYQLTTSIPQVTADIVNAIDQDGLIFVKSLKTQVDALIRKPLSKFFDTSLPDGRSQRRNSVLVIIDGLDECSDAQSQRRILDALLSAVQNSSAPLCFFIASRPEHEIRRFFNQDNVDARSRRLVLDDKYEPDKDIAIFLRSRFNCIRQDHPSGPHLPSSWPTDSDIELLVQKASGQFIYASTVMKFVESPRHWPTDRLDVIFGLASPGSNTPFADLDALYYHVFASVEDIERVIDTFAVLLFKGSELSDSMSAIEHFLCFRRGELQIILNDLHSIISVPTSGSDSQNLRLFHASLGDFLLDKSRSRNFFIDASQAHERLTRYCIKHMTRFVNHAPRTGHLDALLFKVSCSGLLKHCILISHPTRAMQEDLYTLNFEQYLNLLTAACNAGTLTMGAIDPLPFFLQWIETQSYPDHENDLTVRYTAHVNRHILSRLSQYPKCSASFNLFAASTLSSFQSCRVTVFDVLSKKTLENPDGVDLEESDTASLRLRFPGHRALEGYYNMVNQFLTDATRAGIYHVDRLKYRTLAKLMIDNLAASHTQEIEECCLDLLEDILSCIPNDLELAKYLQGNPVLGAIKFATPFMRENARLVIESFIEDSTTSADSLTVELVRPPTTERDVLESSSPVRETPTSAISPVTESSDSAHPVSSKSSSKSRKVLSWFKKSRSK